MSEAEETLYDTIIVGGGPAGLSAALLLARCRRSVLVFDHGKPRNAASKAMHGFLTRDGIPPAEFLEIAKADVMRYPGVALQQEEVVQAERVEGGFSIQTRGGQTFRSRTLLLASGVVDVLPEIPGFQQFWGRTIHHCPYCDGWEHRDQSMVVLGAGKEGAELAFEMMRWSRQLTLCTNGEHLGEGTREVLAQTNIVVRTEKIARLEGEGDQLRQIVFEDSPSLACTTLFFSTTQQQSSELGLSLGCHVSEDAQIDCSEAQCTGVDGLYVVGNAARGLQLVVIAAAEGTRAAFAINEELSREELKRMIQQSHSSNPPATTQE